MRLKVEHALGRREALRRIREAIDLIMQSYGAKADDVETTWVGDTLDFVVKAKGLKGKGSIEVSEDMVDVRGKLPIIALPFEPRIRTEVESRLRQILA
jgi:hypothetical protein